MIFHFTHKSQAAARRKAFAGRAGFTLVEIILAIGLATALLLAALTFYQQTTEMRGQILRESEQFSTLRLVMDRMAGDLRAAQSQARPGNEFQGDVTSMRFIKLTCPSPSLNSVPGTGEPTDLVRISLTMITSTNGTNIAVTGLDRVEESLGPAQVPSAPSTNSVALATNLDDQTSQVIEPFADMIRFVRFRYWDGAAWQASWTNSMPPPGVEILLATTGLAPDAGPDTYPPDLFRRVVFLPGGVPHPAPDNGLAVDNAIH